MSDIDQLVASETAKRDHSLSDQQRWSMILAAIEWADRQNPISRNSRRACKLHEEMILGQNTGGTTAVTS